MVLPKTGLETHPAGAGTNPNAIILANWERLEEIFESLADGEGAIWDSANKKFVGSVFETASKTYFYGYSSGDEVFSLGAGGYASPSSSPVIELSANFSYSGGSVVYDGTEDVWVKVIAEGVITSDANNTTISCYWAKNWTSGAPTGRDLNSVATVVVDTAGDLQHAVVSWWVQLSTNDTIDFVVSPDIAADVTISKFKFRAEFIDIYVAP